MKFAFVNGRRQEAQLGLTGECRACGAPMVAKCGEVRVRHWAHRGRRLCDRWWENETEWHRNWKDLFPVDWQEFVQNADDGEPHIADVKTDRGWAIEFQHSYIKPDERRSREAFYGPKLVWVVDGLRRNRDSARFLTAWEEGIQVTRNPQVRRVWVHEGALLRDWAGSTAHVFFDLGDEQELWWLWPESHDTWAYATPFPRATFIESHRPAATRKAREFGWFVKAFSGLVAYDKRPRTPVLPSVFQPRPVLRLSRTEALRRHRARRRRRL